MVMLAVNGGRSAGRASRVTTLVWSSAFVRAFKHVNRRQAVLRARIERTLCQLAEDPFHPLLHSHKLEGQLADAWACGVGYDVRILFDFARNPATGLTLGAHNKVY